MTNNKGLIEQYRGLQAALGHGCHDGYCVIEETKGMHTNGGCDCLLDLNFRDRQLVGHILRITQKMADTIEELEAKLEKAETTLDWVRMQEETPVFICMKVDHILKELGGNKDE